MRKISKLFELELAGLPPSVNQMYRTGRSGNRYKKPDVSEWQDEIADLIREAWGKDRPYTEEVEVHVLFRVKGSRRWDVDNRLEVRLKRVMRRVSAVDRLREDLVNGRVITVTKPENLVLVLDKYYIAGVTIYEFLNTFHWSRSIFYVRRRELVMITGEYLRA